MRRVPAIILDHASFDVTPVTWLSVKGRGRGVDAKQDIVAPTGFTGCR